MQTCVAELDVLVNSLREDLSSEHQIDELQNKLPRV